MASTKTGKYGAYQEIFNKVDPSRQAVAEKYIAELKFMETQLRKLKQTIRKEGAVDEFQQGKQSMMRESPAMKAYCSLVQRYGDMGKKLADLLPDKKDMARSAAGEKLGAPDKTLVVGNPVRPEVFAQAANREAIRAQLGAGDRTVILSFGGSLGARRVNEVVADLCAWEQHEHKPVLHLHATGQYGVQLFEQLQKQKDFAPGDSLVVKEYINNMPELLAAADLVISRAGALTLAELEAVGRAAVLIPSPNVAENHQYYNAMELQKAGAAVVIEEKDLTGEKLVQTVSAMLAQPGKLAEMGKNARSLSVDDSLDRITAALLKLVKTP